MPTKTNNTPNAKNKVAVVAGAAIQGISLEVDVTAAGQAFKVVTQADVNLSCGQKIESLVGRATITRAGGATEDVSDKISWMWIGKVKHTGSTLDASKIEALRKIFDTSTNTIVVLATVSSGGREAKVKISYKIACDLPGKDGQSDDVILLARLVYAEAGTTQTDEEKAAIAWSVINRKNRIASGDAGARKAFGAEATLTSVITHKADGRVQYEAYWKQDAQWKAIDEPQKLSCDGCARLRKSLEIAEKALSGKIADPYASQGGSYYFHLARDGVASGERRYAIKRLPKRDDFTHHFWTYDPQ
jgi:hypothetical protein